MEYTSAAVVPQVIQEVKSSLDEDSISFVLNACTFVEASSCFDLKCSTFSERHVRVRGSRLHVSFRVLPESSSRGFVS